MKNAIEQRKEWRRLMKLGEVPDDVLSAILAYKIVSNQEDWRATKTYEAIGEAAVLWLESLRTNHGSV